LKDQRHYINLSVDFTATITVFLKMHFFSSKPAQAFSPLAESDLKNNVEGKEFLIVGGTKGIGHALMESLIKHGARVTITGRSFTDETGALTRGANFVKSDLSTLKAARELVQNELKGRTFDTVVFTVGIFSSKKIQRNSEGVEQDLATSYLSRFIIANELIKANAIQGRKRIYVMGYPGEEQSPVDIEDINFERTDYSAFPAHFNTVVFNEALTYELARRHPDIHVFGLNPGLIQTGIRDNFHGGGSSMMGRAIEFMIGVTMRSAEQYVESTLLPLVASPDLDAKTGVSFSKYGAALPMRKWMSNPENRLKVWEASEKLVNSVLSSTQS